MSFSKWIGASIGWSVGGPIGAIIGLALGGIVDAIAGNSESPLLRQGQPRRRSTNQKRYSSRPERPRTQPGDFEVSLLILASIIIKADDRQDQRELDFVRQQFVTMYGKDRANHAFKLFKNISKQKNANAKKHGKDQCNGGILFNFTACRYPIN